MDGKTIASYLLPQPLGNPFVGPLGLSGSKLEPERPRGMQYPIAKAVQLTALHRNSVTSSRTKVSTARHESFNVSLRPQLII